MTQAPLDGVSFAQTLDDAAAPSRHHTEYFEMLGHRAIDHDGWRAVCPWPGPSFAEAGMGFGQPTRRSGCRSSTPPAGSCTTWPRIRRRPTTSLPTPDRLIAMIALWYVEAGRNGVLPIDGSGLERMIAEKPQAAPARDRYTYRPGTQAVPFFAGPRVLNRPHSITARWTSRRAAPRGSCDAG